MRSHHWLILFLATAVAVLALASSTHAREIPADLPVAGHFPISSETVYVRGNITVVSDGWLDLTNVDMVFNCTVDGQYTISVEDGGKLTFNGGSISANDPRYRYKVELRDETVLEAVLVSDTWATGTSFDVTQGSEPNLVGLKGGVQVYSDDVYIGNCTFQKGLLCGVYARGVTPTLLGNTFKDVIYDVRSFSQSTGNPSSTRWSAMAFGVLLDDAPAVLRSNHFMDIGDFPTMAAVFYRDSAVNNNDYYVIAAGVAARNTRLDMNSNTVSSTGVLTTTSDTFTDGGNTVNQRFYVGRVAGVYAFEAWGADAKTNEVKTSAYGMYLVVSTSGAGAPMTFDVIIDNILSDNSKGGAFFLLKGVSRACAINVSENNLDRNGDGTVSGLDDCGLVVSAVDCTGDLEIILQQNVFGGNHARGTYVDVHNHVAKVTVLATYSNTYTGNRGAGLKLNLDSVGGDVELLVENSTFTDNHPTLTGDSGAISLEGDSLTQALRVKLADATVSGNNGNGLGIELGGTLAVNLAKSARYTLHRCNFNTNTQRGVYIYDSYGANAQDSVWDWRHVNSVGNPEAVYVYSQSQLGKIDFRAQDLVATDSSTLGTAVTLNLAAPNYVNKVRLRDIRITYTSGPAPSATGLVLQGVDEDNRMGVNLVNSFISTPGTSLDAQFCEVTATRCNLTGTGVNSVIARDSNIHLYYCDIPDLSATTMGVGIHIGVFYYEWFNVSRVSWQNNEPIRNSTIVIRRFREPTDEIYRAKTDINGMLAYAQVPYWIKDENNNPLRNDELEAFLTIHGETIQSLPFDFNVSKIGIEDPQLPELVINTPVENTVQKSGTIIIQGEIRDTHSGIKAVQVTLDNVVWHNITDLAKRAGQTRATFSYPIPDLTDGVYTITIRGWDVARWGNLSLGVAHVTIKNVKVDTEPPFLQMLQPANPYSVTNNRTYVLIGQTERSVNIKRLTINDLPVTVFTQTFTYETSLIEGSNTFVIIAEDTAGNIAVATRQIILDTIKPTLIVTTPVDGFSSKEQDFEVSGDTEQTAKVFVQLDERPPAEVVDRGGTRFYFIQNIRHEGLHAVTIISRDVAGNENREQIYVKYDITPPVLEDIIPTQDPKPTNDQRVYVSGRTDLEVETVSVNGLMFAVHQGAFALKINLLEGLQTLTIEVTDAAGNYNTTTRQILIDVTPPMAVDLEVVSTRPNSEPWPLEEGMVINERSVRFKGRMEQSDAREIWIQVGTDNRRALEEDPERDTFYRDFNLDEGNNLVSISAVDHAGNELTLRFNLTVDPRAPVLKYFNPKFTSAMEATSREDTVLISGQVEEEGVVLMINNRNVAVRPDTGAFQTNVPLVEGVNNIEVVATDRAGNTLTEVLHITYDPKEGTDESAFDLIKVIIYAVVIVVVLGITVPLWVQFTRSKWMKEHPELEDYDPKMARDGLYDFEDQYGYDDRRRGGGY